MTPETTYMTAPTMTEKTVTDDHLREPATDEPDWAFVVMWLMLRTSHSLVRFGKLSWFGLKKVKFVSSR